MVDRKRTSIVLPALVLILGLVGAYFGAYYAVMKPIYLANSVETWVLPTYPRQSREQQLFGGHPGIDPGLCARIFRPAHWFDRAVIRPQFWKRKPQPTNGSEGG